MGFVRWLDRDWQNKKQVVNQVVVSSKADFDYYFLLSLATVVTLLGIIFEDQVIFLGGILVAPLLSPVLALGLSIVTGNISSIFRSLKNIILSLFVIVLLTFVAAFALRIPADHVLILSEKMRVGTHYLYVAILSGMAASYSWVRQKTLMTLPGVAMAVSLLPPVIFWGLAWYIRSMVLLYDAFLLFSLNLLGVVLSSVLVFLVTGFSSLDKEEDKIIKKNG